MSKRKEAYYVVATATEVLSGADRDGIGDHYLTEYHNVLASLMRLRDRLSSGLPSEDVTVEVSLRDT